MPSAPTLTSDVLSAGLLRSVHQPLVDLSSGRVVGHEALLRGPRGSELESPLALLTRATAEGRLTELDLEAARTALRHAAARTADAPMTLFLNLEPSTVTEASAELLAILTDRPAQLQVVVELTERALAADPAGILDGAERLRAAGCAIALDDVGADPASLAFIPVLRPEVVKLDLRLLRTLEDPATITVAGAVRAYAEATGAEVVAEGIEEPEDLTRALVLGATLGQGWHWGRPDEPLHPHVVEPERFTARPVGAGLCTTPYVLVESHARIHRAPKRLLLPLSRTVELDALAARVPPMLLAGFQEARHLTPRTRRHYENLGAQLPFVGALGVGMPEQPASGVHGGALHPTDDLAREWTVVVLGAHEATAVIAREVPADGPVADGDRPFDFLVTHDRTLVTAAAHALIGRLGPRRA